MRSHFFFLSTLLCLIQCTGCRKADPIVAESAPELTNSALVAGIPPSIDSVNGVLCAMFLSSKLPGNTHYALTLSAVFRDPCANLLSIFNSYNGPYISYLGNVFVGDVSFNAQELIADTLDGHSFYWLSQVLKSSSLIQGTRWQTEGNRSFKKLDISVERGFPAFKDTVLALKKSQLLKIDPGLIFKNYDSLFVAVSVNTAPDKKYWEHAGSGIVPIQFDSAVVSSLNLADYHTLTAVLVNYSHVTIENKRYVFILSQKIHRHVVLQP